MNYIKQANLSICGLYNLCLHIDSIIPIIPGAKKLNISRLL